MVQYLLVSSGLNTCEMRIHANVFVAESKCLHISILFKPNHLCFSSMKMANSFLSKLEIVTKSSALRLSNSWIQMMDHHHGRYVKILLLWHMIEFFHEFLSRILHMFLIKQLHQILTKL